MEWRQLAPWLARVCAGLVLGGLVMQTAAYAQGPVPPPEPADLGDRWSFVVTPQVWVSHIAKNGFAAAPNSSIQGTNALATPDGNFFQNPFPSESSPVNTFNGQWGIQFAGQKDRWSFAAAFQYVTFETVNTLTYENSAGLRLLGQSPGTQWDQETVDTTRMDIDLAASYFFLDIATGWLDVSLGTGFKFIYADASRTFGSFSAAAATFNARPPGGLYTICYRNPCAPANASPGGISSHSRVTETSYFYLATFPMSAVTHLTKDSRWLLPLSITPMIGAEVRDDKNVAYSVNLPQTVREFLTTTPMTVNRLDGTSLAYGVTGDLTLRWIINDMVSAYAGVRVQYIKGHDEYLAYGPLIGMSFRF
jgi:hypothetical protein